MKTIKLILNADGSVNSLTYGFQLNQYSYADTLINIYVPTEIVDLNITQLDGATYSTNVIMSVNYLQANGTYKLGNPYYFTYVKTNVIIDNVNYTLFERTMPREFTLNYGLQKFGASVVSIKTTTENGVTTNEVIGVITTSNFELNINQASNMVDNPIETDTDLSTLIANVNALLSNILLKQDKNDNLIQVSLVNGGLTTTDSVVIALNSLNDRAEQNYDNIDINTQDITQLKQDVIDINNSMITGMRYCGSVTSPNAPTSALLDSQMTTWGLTKQNGDTIIWTETISGATDKSYTCRYGIDGWGITDMPTIESASNTDAGLIKGNYGSDTTSNILASIVGGKIVDIYYKNGANYYSVGTDLTNAITNIANIVNGTTTVGKSQYATYDITEYGSATPQTINDKFLSKDLGATKQFVKDYALPKQFGDVYFLNTTDSKFKTNLVITSDKLETISSSIGAIKILDATMSVGDYEYSISNKNSIEINSYIALTNSDNITLTLKVYYGGTQIANFVSDTIQFIANNSRLVKFNSYFNLLSDTDEIQVDSNNSFRVEIYANMTISTSTTITLYSNTTLPTSLNLNVYYSTLRLATGYLGEINSLSLSGNYNSQTFTYDFALQNGETLYQNCIYAFTLNYSDTIYTFATTRIVDGNSAYKINGSIVTNLTYQDMLKYRIGNSTAIFITAFFNGFEFRILDDKFETNKMEFIKLGASSTGDIDNIIPRYSTYIDNYPYLLGIIGEDASSHYITYMPTTVSTVNGETVMNYRSAQIFTDANGNYIYSGTLNFVTGHYQLLTKTYITSPTESYYKISLSDIGDVGGTSYDSGFTLFVDKQDFNDLLTTLNQLLGTSMSTPQDFIDLYDTLKGNSSYFGGFSLAFSELFVSNIKANYNNNLLVDFTYEKIIKVNQDTAHVYFSGGDLFEQTPTVIGQISFSSSSSLSITTVTSQKLN